MDAIENAAAAAIKAVDDTPEYTGFNFTATEHTPTDGLLDGYDKNPLKKYYQYSNSQGFTFDFDYPFSMSSDGGMDINHMLFTLASNIPTRRVNSTRGNMLPSPGYHYYSIYNSKLCVFVEFLDADAGNRNTLYRYTIFYNNADDFAKFSRYCHKLFNKKDDEPADTFAVRVNEKNYWSHPEYRQKRRADTIFLADNQTERLVEGIRAFKSDESISDYAHWGIPHVYTAILHGPPGSGKSSLVDVAASELNMTKRVINLKTVNIDGLRHLLLDVRNSIVVLEDIDAMYVGRTAHDTTVSFGDFINLLDGALSMPGTIFILTTNHVKKLDPALFRPGRVKLMLELTYIGKDEIKSMWDRHYEALHNGKFNDFYNALTRHIEGENVHITPAELLMFMFNNRKFAYDEMEQKMDDLIAEIKFRQSISNPAQCE